MSEMKHDSKFQQEHEAALEEHRVERAKAAAKASEALVAEPGFPARLDEGGTVMIVRKAAEGQRIIHIAADGSRYVRNFKDRLVPAPAAIQEQPLVAATRIDDSGDIRFDGSASSELQEGEPEPGLTADEVEELEAREESEEGESE